MLCKLFSSPRSLSEEFALDLETTGVFAIVMDGVRDAVDVGDEAVEFDADADASGLFMLLGLLVYEN